MVLDQSCLALLATVAAANLVGALAVAADKRRARLGKRRVPELAFHAAGFLGGWPLMGIAMRSVRHKTRKASFLAAFVAASVVGTGLLVWVLLRLDCWG